MVVAGWLRGSEKAALLKSVGADLVVDPSQGNLEKPIREFLRLHKLRGVDVLYDPVGGRLFKESLKLLNWSAQIVVVGFASGEIPSIPANIALVKVKYPVMACHKELNSLPFSDTAAFSETNNKRFVSSGCCSELDNSRTVLGQSLSTQT